jgi:NADP-dependent 3-hydroxy acid dehydrogenase YdfG
MIREIRVPEARSRLEGKLALVTGATSGIGRATAVALAREGAMVIATGRRESELADLVKSCAPGRIQPVAGDMADTAFVQRLAADSSRADILCANAGTCTYAPFLEITTDEIEAMFRVNVVSTTHLLQAMARAMAERKAGHIVVMTSIAAREIYRFGSVYSATKHALTAIVQSMRLELRSSRVKITEVRTGTVATAVHNAVRHPAVLKAFAARTYTALTPDEVADTVVQALCAPANLSTELIEMRPVGS